VWDKRILTWDFIIPWLCHSSTLPSSLSTS
jgi:hypothetical protein